MPRPGRDDSTVLVGLHYLLSPEQQSLTTKRVMCEDVREYHQLLAWLKATMDKTPDTKPYFEGKNFFIPTIQGLHLVTILGGGGAE